MTSGEKTIWAVAYVLHLQEHRANIPKHLLDLPANADKHREWEDSGAVIAAEHAWWAVDCAQCALPSVKEVYGEDEDVYLMLLEMTQEGGMSDLEKHKRALHHALIELRRLNSERKEHPDSSWRSILAGQDLDPKLFEAEVMPPYGKSK